MRNSSMVFILVTAVLLSAGTDYHARSQTASTDHTDTDYHRLVVLNAPFAGIDQTIAYGINNLGTIVGYYHDADGPHGFLLDHDTFTRLNAPFPGALNTIAFGINDESDIVGDYTSNGLTHSFLLHHGVYTSFDYPTPTVSQTAARCINDRGQIVGEYLDASGSHGFLLDHGRFTALDAPFAGASNTTANAINNLGDIVGAYRGSDGLIHGFLERNDHYTALDMPGATETQPYGINDLDEIVGDSFFYRHETFSPLSDLNPSLVPGSTGFAINDRGEILATSPSYPNVGLLLLPQ
jgi:uncharacterized membrane protein